MIIIVITLLVIVAYIAYIELRYILDWQDLPFSSKKVENPPLVSVLIPMRNEEKAIINCLESLYKQTYTNMEIIVIDDCSDDSSNKLVREYISNHPAKRIELIRITHLPDGWVGKCNALTEGIKETKGEWFLFSDADVIHHPETLQSAIHYVLNHNIKFLSLKFRKTCIGFWEKVIVPYTYFVKGWYAPSPSQISNMEVQSATATGDFILMNREAYESFDGHAHPQVKKHLIEDASIARVAKQGGVAPVIMDGRYHIAVRKFNNLKEIFAGFGKIIANEFQRKSIITYLKQVSMMVVYSILPFIFLFIVRSPVLMVINLSIVIMIIGMYAFYLSKERHPQYYGLFIPLGACMLILICTYSLLQVHSKKGVQWRGRKYDSACEKQSARQDK